MDPGSKQLIGLGEDVCSKGIPISRGHRVKRLGESVGSIIIQFDSVGVLDVRKPRVSYK